MLLSRWTSYCDSYLSNCYARLLHRKISNSFEITLYQMHLLSFSRFQEQTCPRSMHLWAFSRYLLGKSFRSIFWLIFPLTYYFFSPCLIYPPCFAFPLSLFEWNSLFFSLNPNPFFDRLRCFHIYELSCDHLSFIQGSDYLLPNFLLESDPTKLFVEFEFYWLFSVDLSEVWISSSTPFAPWTFSCLPKPHGSASFSLYQPAYGEREILGLEI